MAPRFRVALSSGTTRAASMRISWPMPPQVGQAPNGLLNENSRGSISAIVKPETGQANFDEKVMRFGLAVLAASRRPIRSRAMPSARSSAVSRESDRRAAMSGRTTMPVHHHVDVVLELLVERRRVVDRRSIRRRSSGAGSPSSGTRRSPCGTRPCGRAPPARAGRAGSSPAGPAPGPPSGDTVWLSIGRPVAGE